MKSLIACLTFCIFASFSWGQTKPGSVRVVTRLVKPFVFEEGGRLSGFSIDLWNEIARQLNVKTEFVVKPTVTDLFAAMDRREAELGIAAISITAERELRWDFSQPMFDAGLQILVPAQVSEVGLIGNITAGIFTTDFLIMIAVVLALIAIPAHIVWLLERRPSGGLLAKRTYYPGIFEAAWWASATLATQADQMPRSAMARITAVIWMFSSVVFIAYFTANVTSNLTLQQLRGDIKGPQDLPGKRVASVKGSTAAEYLRQHNIDAAEFANVEETYQALQQSQVSAVVYDAPVLLYYASHTGKGKVLTVGPIFRKENYGIVFPDKSPQRKQVNEVLLKLKENGTYEQLYAKWFGGGVTP